jgi:TrmH family RNA methyltransferase
LDEAIADCHRVYATTARSRSLAQPVKTAEEAAREIRGEGEEQDKTAILFGPEASGLDGESIARADTLVRFPTNPDFASLNLAQAVLLFGWEWRRVEGITQSDSDEDQSEGVASRDHLDHFLGRLFDGLEEKGFFLTEELRPHTERSLRGLFSRARATEREIQLLQGVLTALQEGERSRPT